MVFFYWHQVNISIKEAQSLLYMAKNKRKYGHFCSSGNIGPTSKINIVCVCWTEKAAMYSFRTIIAFLRYSQYLLVKLKSWQSKSNLFLLDLVLQEKQWLTIQLVHYKLQPSWILLQIAWEFPQANSLKEMDDKIQKRYWQIQWRESNSYFISQKHTNETQHVTCRNFSTLNEKSHNN